MTRPDAPEALQRIEPPPRPFRTLRHRDYRQLWTAEFISTSGSQIQRVAIAWQVYQLTGDPFQLGLLGLFRFLPVFLFGIVGGVMADRQDRRRLLLFSQSILLCTSSLLALLTFTDRITMPVIYAITFASYAVAAIGGPSRQALIPALVPEQELTGAMTMNTLSMQVATVMGPALGGVLIAQTGVATAYLVDAASFIVVILAVLTMKTRPAIRVATSSSLTAAIEGFLFVRNQPILLGVMGLDFVATFFGASNTLMPIFAEDVLGIGATGLGLLYSAPAAGAVTGSLIMSVSGTVRRPGLGVLLAVAGFGACLIGFGLSNSILLSLLFLAGSGAADAVSMALRMAIRMLVTPDELRGRIAALHSMFAMGGPQLGEFQAGALASVIGVSLTVVIGGSCTVLASAATARLVPAISRFRTDREFDPPGGR
jgi:MFS family permease